MKNNMKKITLILFGFFHLVAVAQQPDLANFISFDHPSFGLYAERPDDSTYFEMIEVNKRSTLISKVDIQKYSIIEIPIIFHLLESEAGEMPEINRISSQVQILNDAFSGILASRSGLKMQDSGIRFCISTENGISKKSISWKTALANLNTLSDEVIGDKAQGPQKGIDIWVARFDENIAGFATSPNLSQLQNGVYFNSKYFYGNSSELYGEGKSLIHLLGRYLGLMPLWGESLCIDDGVSDTPIHNAPNLKCYDFGHMSTCGYNIYELTNNFMDALPDECASMFTNGQIARMRAVIDLIPGRSELKNISTPCK
ncbi:MAG TPA: M43 family zinc metalloprotease [Saprospiraceae bacterium]|nr:M43 family zinc metalloprotease [Saprospiraceae bacterium]